MHLKGVGERKQNFLQKCNNDISPVSRYFDSDVLCHHIIFREKSWKLSFECDKRILAYPVITVSVWFNESRLIFFYYPCRQFPSPINSCSRICQTIKHLDGDKTKKCIRKDESPKQKSSYFWIDTVKSSKKSRSSYYFEGILYIIIFFITKQILKYVSSDFW